MEQDGYLEALQEWTDYAVEAVTRRCLAVAVASAMFVAFMVLIATVAYLWPG